MMLADMGAPVNTGPVFPPPSRYSRPYARFRAIVAVVRATLRFRYVCKRKRDYLQAKVEKLNLRPIHSSDLYLRPKVSKTDGSQQKPVIMSYDVMPSTSVGIPQMTTISGPVINESRKIDGQSVPSEIGLATGIPTIPSGIGFKSHLQSRSRTAATSGGNVQARNRRSSKPSGSVHTMKKSKGANSASKVTSKTYRHIPVSHSGSKILKQSSLPAKHNPKSKENMKSRANLSRPAKLRGPSSGHLSSVAPSLLDPQLLEYMEGLERLRTRLS